MGSFKLSRRSVLRGAGVTVALPWLEAMSGSTRAARAAGAPKRFVAFFTPNGTIREAWTPTGTETEFTMSRILKPLEDAGHKSDLVILDGVDNVAATKGPGDDHMRGMGSMLTGTELLPGKTLGGGGTPAGYAAGASVDQALVQTLKPNTRFPSLELGVKAGSTGTVWGYSNYRAANQPLPLDNNPANVFRRVFGEVGVTAGDNSAFLRARAERKSVLDAVLKNYRYVNGRVGVEDRRRLDQHLTTVDELQKRLLSSAQAPVSKSCTRPIDPMKPDFNSNDLFPTTGKLQMDLLVQALKCDLTRFATLQWQNSVGGVRFTWLGATRGHHDLSHDPDTALDSKEMLTKINEWFSLQFAYLLTQMKMVKEEDGTSLLDNTVVLWVNELSRGNSHSHPDMPYLLAGKGGGALRTGRFLAYDRTVNAPHNNLLVSILNMFGVQTTTFGDPKYCTGPLARLL